MIPFTLPHPIYEGSDGVPSSPRPWDILIDGRTFMLDRTQDYAWNSIPLLRQQADDADRPSERSLNPDDLWPRTVDSWHKGAGQKFYDAPDSDPDRFFASKGVDPWERGELSLLPDVSGLLSSTDSNIRAATTGERLYVTYGQNVLFSSDLMLFDPVFGIPVASAHSITSDGTNTYLGYPTDGIYLEQDGTAASFATGDTEGVKWVQGRLFVWNDAELFNVTEAGALGAAGNAVLIEQQNEDFTWVDVAATSGFYYLAGYAGDKSLIFYTSVKDDGTGMEVPLEAAQLPDGEIVRAVYGYLGFLLIGTDKGVRFATTEGGPLNIGSLIETGDAVRCFEGQGRFVWFGWDNYDADSTGLGRVDLSVFNVAQPAYASDLMAAGSGAIRSVVTFSGRRVFTVAGQGVFTHSGTVAEGWVTTGQITYGLAGDKVAHHIQVRHEPDAVIGLELSKDRGVFSELAASSASTTRTVSDAGKTLGETFQIRLTLDEGVVTRLRLRAYPLVDKTEEILVPLLLGLNQQDRNGSTVGRDPDDDLAFLLDKEQTGESFSLDDGLRSGVTVLEDHRWAVGGPDGEGWAGTFLGRFKKFPTE